LPLVKPSSPYAIQHILQRRHRVLDIAPLVETEQADAGTDLVAKKWTPRSLLF